MLDPRLFHLLLLALTCLVTAPRAAAADIRVSGSVDSSLLEAAGRFVIHLRFEVDEAPGAASDGQPAVGPFRVRVAVASGQEVLFDRDHSPPTPSITWQAGQVVEYELPSLFPMGTLDRDLVGELGVFVGFLDTAASEKVLPAGTGPALDDMRRIAGFSAPSAPVELTTAAEEEALARAEKLADAKDPAAAWDVLEYALRRSRDYQQKERLRKAMEGLGHFPPRPLTAEEEGIVAARIRAEKTRYLRMVAGWMQDAGQRRGALVILDEVGGLLQEDSTRAEIGALAEVDRVTRDADSIRLALLRESMEADEQLVAKMRPLPRWEDPERLRKTLTKLMNEGHFGGAYEIASKAEFSSNVPVREAAIALKAEIRRRVGEGATPAELERVAEARDHPAWGRLTWAASHEFIYIGPRTLIEGLTRNPESTRRFDLSYIFQTDLFGRTPNPGGDRLTVFFKELWDFNGGVGGGKIIDIGNANPDERKARVDNGLLYHELTHNVYDVVPGYPGFTEGIANFGAAFSYDVLDQKADGLHSFRSNLEAFENDYLGRDLDFWRIQNYGPSAGFFLYFIDRYGKEGKRYRWSLYRDFFHAYNRTPLRDGRPHGIIRALGHYLVQSFGQTAFDDLVRFRFPLTESDREVLAEEVAAGDGRFPPWARLGRGHEVAPNSPANRDVLYQRLAGMNELPFAEVREFCESQLGVLYDWQVGGPFLANSGRSFAEVFAPELGEIVFSKRYEQGKHTALWRRPTTQEGDYVTHEKNGWVTLDYPYPDHVSAYAYSRLTVPTARPALLHLRTDDHMTVWLNRRFLRKMKNIGAKGSTQLRWRGRKVTDELAVPIELTAGANELLLKVTNGRGKAGFVVAVTDPVGRVMEDLQVDTRAPTDETTTAAAAASFKKAVTFTDRRLSAVKATVGSFAAKRRSSRTVLVGTATDRRVEWRKYTVRPGVNKDAPSNLGWLPAKATRDLEDFRLELELALDAEGLPKLTVTFDGDGEKDGLAGWTLVFVPDGQRLHVRLEKYDDLFFRSWNHELPAGKEHRLVVERVDERVLVQLGDVVLLDRIHVPPIAVPDRRRIGLATWGPQVGVAAITLRR